MTPEETMSPQIVNLLELCWWFFLLIIFWGLLKLSGPAIKGKFGESMVNLAAKLRLDPGIYRLLKDVTIPTKTGTTQIDHVIVPRFGLFVIETKNYKGWIFADAKNAKWTRVHFKQKHSFQNPLRQNYAHICALSELLGISKDKMTGIVCFMGDATFKTPVPNGVFLGGRYVNYIRSFQVPVFSNTEVQEITQRIESGRFERGSKTNRAHVQQLKIHHTSDTGKASFSKNYSALNDSANTSPQTCPACGSIMILRTAKKGPNRGNKFWGCSRYPACRAIMPFHN